MSERCRPWPVLHHSANRSHAGCVQPHDANIQPEYLDKINQGYLNYIKSYPHQNSLIIDVSELDFVENPTDYEEIMKNIERQLLLSKD